VSEVLAGPGVIVALFGLGPLFLVAGWLSHRSLDRHGPGAFARSRLVRLGVPLVLYILVVQPLADYLGNRWQETEYGFWPYLTGTEAGVMWFVVELLVLSLAYAGLWAVRPVRRGRSVGERRRLTPGAIVVTAATIAVTSFAVWQVWAPDQEVLWNVRLPQWPQGAVLFALGAHLGGSAWLDDLPRRRMRRLGWTALAGAVALLALFVIAFPDASDQGITTAADPGTAGVAVLYGVIAVTGTLWALAWLRPRLSRDGPLLAKAARASYATYLVHPLVVTLVMMSFRWLSLAVELKWLVVAAVAVPACYVAGYTLTRLPGLSKVL
jgi:peptidoglycan/LPS O-acetylase OafA/YrhL